MGVSSFFCSLVGTMENTPFIFLLQEFYTEDFTLPLLMKNHLFELFVQLYHLVPAKSPFKKLLIRRIHMGCINQSRILGKSRVLTKLISLG